MVVGGGRGRAGCWTSRLRHVMEMQVTEVDQVDSGTNGCRRSVRKLLDSVEANSEQTRTAVNGLVKADTWTR